MKNKFVFYEIVKVTSKKERLKKIYGVEAPIKGMVEEDDGSWGYDIVLPGGFLYGVQEDEIESTGKFADPDDYKPVDTVRVSVMPDGSGEIIRDNED